MNNLETITKAVHAACPELLELSFGCRIEATDGTEHTIVKSFDRGYYKSTEGLLISSECIFKILGHPIQPHHILRALPHFIFLAPDGLFLHHYTTLEKQILPCLTHDGMPMKYDLTKSLQGQSEEVLQFLSDNLK